MHSLPNCVTDSWFKVTTSSNSGGRHLAPLTNGDWQTYWESSGEQGAHWICVHIKPGICVSDVGILVDSGDDSYCPKVITVRADSTMEGLRSQSRTRRDYARVVRSGGQFLLQALEGNVDPSIRVVEIGIADSGGINCKVRGVLVRGGTSRFSDNRIMYPLQQALQRMSSDGLSAREGLEFMATIQSHPFFAPAPPFAQPLGYECVHPYSEKNNTHKQPTSVKVPGADRYEVRFDPLCCTEADADMLIFTVKGEPLASGTRHGPDTGCGWGPLVIPGEEFEFKFVTESGNGQYGYKFTVIPIKDSHSFSRFGESLLDYLSVAICQLCISEKSEAFELPFTLTADGDIAESSLIPVLQGCLSRSMQYNHVRAAVDRSLAMIFIADFDHSKHASAADVQALDPQLRCGTLLLIFESLSLL
jgi:hypothetical protein